MGRKFLMILFCIVVLLGFLVSEHISRPTASASTTDVGNSVSPVIADFYINTTRAGQPSQFSFNVSDSVGLDHAVFGCNSTGTFLNDTTTTLSGTSAWANYTHVLPSSNGTTSFQFWLYNNASLLSTTGLRYATIFINTSQPYIYFNSLSDALDAINSANNWTAADTYAQALLGKKTTNDLAAMIDSYDASQDWVDVLKWSAICNKLGITQQRDILDALGNYTMVGSLPYTDSSSRSPDFTPESKWALYGYYYANMSWSTSAIRAKWNTTLAYSQFNNAINNAFPSGAVLWIWANGSGENFHNRYYDERACSLECYLIFAELLNVTGALTNAINSWNTIVGSYWDSTNQYFVYTPGAYYPAFECEAPFFLMIISQLKYYSPSVSYWNYVLQDIGTRFLSKLWNSAQWETDIFAHPNSSTTHVVVHEDNGTSQERLENTLGAWEAMLGVYMLLNSTYQANIATLLSGSQQNDPAWSLLLSSSANLFDTTTNMFKWHSDSGDDSSATAYGMILLVLMGMIPGTTTVAFPLEELNYEYIQDVDPRMLQLDLTTQTITVPVNSAGSMTFQYGESPLTYFFSQGGIWQVKFSNSWNQITNTTYVSAFPANRIYFTQIYNLPPAPYDVTINAHCITEGADVKVQIAMNGSPTGYTTPYTFTALNGTHTFTVSDNDTGGDPFKQWSSGQTGTTITVSLGGTYVAYYGTSPVHDVAVTGIAPSKTVVGQNYSVNVNVTAANPGNYPETFDLTLFANTIEIAEVSVADVTNGTSAFVVFAWNTTWYAHDNYTISAVVRPVLNETDLSDNTLVSGPVCVTIPGDINGDFKVSLQDLVRLANAYGSKPSDAKWNPNADIDGNGIIDQSDANILAQNYGKHYP
jgi:hypothetical protein